MAQFAFVNGSIVPRAEATLSILDISISQSSRITERVDADQRGRLAMEKIMLELHSGCVAYSGNPVEPGSTGNIIKFISQAGSEAYFTSVTKHELKLTGATLTDASYVSTNTESELGAAWQFPAVATSTQPLLIGVNQSGETPIFRYYKYATASNGGEEEIAGKKTATGLNALKEIPVGKELGSASAKETAAVLIRFRALPTNGNNKLNRGADMNTQVVFAFSAPGAEATIKDAPCN